MPHRTETGRPRRRPTTPAGRPSYSPARRLAVALLAGLDPLGVVVAGILFGALQAGAGAMQRDAGVPAAWVGVVEALVILAVLALDRLRRVRRRGGV